MPKQISVDVLISQMHKLSIEDMLTLQRETAKSISEEEATTQKSIKELQEKMEKIRTANPQ